MVKLLVASLLKKTEFFSTPIPTGNHQFWESYTSASLWHFWRVHFDGMHFKQVLSIHFSSINAGRCSSAITSAEQRNSSRLIRQKLRTSQARAAIAVRHASISQDSPFHLCDFHCFNIRKITVFVYFILLHTNILRVYPCGSICKNPLPLVQSNIPLNVCIHLCDTACVGSFHILTSGIMGSVNMSRQIKIIKILQFALLRRKNEWVTSK